MTAAGRGTALRFFGAFFGGAGGLGGRAFFAFAADDVESTLRRDVLGVAGCAGERFDVRAESVARLRGPVSRLPRPCRFTDDFALFGQSEFGATISGDAAPGYGRRAIGLRLGFEMLARRAQSNASQSSSDRKDDFVDLGVVEQLEYDVECVPLVFRAVRVRTNGDANASRFCFASEPRVGFEVLLFTVVG